MARPDPSIVTQAVSRLGSDLSRRYPFDVKLNILGTEPALSESGQTALRRNLAALQRNVAAETVSAARRRRDVFLDSLPSRLADRHVVAHVKWEVSLRTQRRSELEDFILLPVQFALSDDGKARVESRMVIDADSGDIVYDPVVDYLRRAFATRAAMATPPADWTKEVSTP